jgi:hypothetical protein
MDMKNRVFLAVALLAALCVSPVAMPAKPASANPVGVFISNTQIASNKGLAFCAPGMTKGCIESITVDGVPLTPVNTIQQARYFIGGGLYGSPCRFVATSVSQCEFPYLVILPSPMQPNAPLDTVVVNFRRQTADHPTSAINTVVVNGSLQSFTPAAPGVGDVATITAKAAEIHSASTSFCLGWVTEIDSCTIGNVATQRATNRVSMLLLPGMRSSVVPPDLVDETCTTINPSNNAAVRCIINVFEEQSRGGWIDTDASVFGLASTDRLTGAAQLKIAGPHYKLPINGVSDLNLSYFRMFIPTPYLDISFGLTPQQANATTLPVRRTAGTGSTTPVTSYTPTATELLVSSTGIGFSAPTMSVQRVLTVKRNQKVTATSLLRAAGVHQSLMFGTHKIVVNSRNGMSFRAKRYRFSKARTVHVTIRYKSTQTTTSERKLTVVVTK